MIGAQNEEVRSAANGPILTRTVRDMSFEVESPAHQRIAREEQARLFGGVAFARVLIMPVFATLVLTVAWFEPILWRRVTLIVMSAALPAFFLVELRRYKKFGFEAHTVPRNIVLTALAQLTVTAATGGLMSPVIYAVIPIAGVAATVLDRPKRFLVAAGQVATVFAFAILAEQRVPGFDSPSLSSAGVGVSGTLYYVHATTLSFVTLAVGQISDLLSGSFGKTFRRATKAQEDLLQSHATRVKELTTLSAEIAHELKNPLASIKGLSALLAQNVTDERSSERLRVLRREIDRMQIVLDEFLNFSRPLVPLSLAECDLHGLTAEVLALHEGLARQKGVRLTLSGTSAMANCDANKVKQILINLAQNALEASPRSGSLQALVGNAADGVLIAVEDEGPGIGSELGDVFQPGITSKNGGSGIGLTIARALARQHGGELTLAARQNGGTRAELFLPKDPLAALAREVA